VGRFPDFAVQSDMHEITREDQQVRVLLTGGIDQRVEHFAAMFITPVPVPGKIPGAAFAPEFQETRIVQVAQVRVGYVDQAHQADYNRLTRIMHQGNRPFT